LGTGAQLSKTGIRPLGTFMEMVRLVDLNSGGVDDDDYDDGYL